MRTRARPPVALPPFAGDALEPARGGGDLCVQLGADDPAAPVEALGALDAGLVFVAFVRDPRRQYAPVQRRLAEDDPLSAYAVHTASAVFAVPPAAPERFRRRRPARCGRLTARAR